MTPQTFRPSIFQALLVLAIFVIVAPPVLAQEATEADFSKLKAIKKLTRGEILQILTHEIDVGKLAATPGTLEDFLLWIGSKIEAKKGIKVPLIVEQDYFKAEAPDAPPVMNTMIKFPVQMPGLTIGEALGVALAAIPTQNASLLIRQGRIIITTESQTHPQYLFREKVIAGFTNKIFAEVMEDLSEQSGLGIVLDPRINDKANKPVSAVFGSNTSLEAAVLILTNMVGVEAILLGDVIYVTTAEHVQKLLLLQKELKAANSNHKFKVVGPLIPGLPGN